MEAVITAQFKCILLLRSSRGASRSNYHYDGRHIFRGNIFLSEERFEARSGLYAILQHICKQTDQ